VEVTEEEVVGRFGEGSVWADERVLKVSGVARVGGTAGSRGVRLRRTHASVHALFEARLLQGARLREETRRHIDATVEALGRDFVCVLAWGAVGPDSHSKVMTPDDMARLLHALAGVVDAAAGVYLAVDGLTAAHLDAIRLLLPHATAFEVYPWLNRGLRRFQQTLLIHHGVCSRASQVVADMDALLPRTVCADWQRARDARDSERALRNAQAGSRQHAQPEHAGSVVGAQGGEGSVWGGGAGHALGGVTGGGAPLCTPLYSLQVVCTRMLMYADLKRLLLMP
jgi:hypothetical protein